MTAAAVKIPNTTNDQNANYKINKVIYLFKKIKRQ